jgi:hypothetical protein
MVLQSCKSPNFENFETPNLEVLRQNARGSSEHKKCSNYALINLLFGLCKSVWIIDPLVTGPSPHPRALTRPFTFEVLRAKEFTPIPYPFDVFILDL